MIDDSIWFIMRFHNCFYNRKPYSISAILSRSCFIYFIKFNPYFFNIFFWNRVTRIKYRKPNNTFLFYNPNSDYFLILCMMKLKLQERSKLPNIILNWSCLESIYNSPWWGLIWHLSTKDVQRWHPGVSLWWVWFVTVSSQRKPQPWELEPRWAPTSRPCWLPVARRTLI